MIAINYTEDSIKVLSDIDHVRTRPQMYINSDRPLHQMFNEILDNSVDEAMNGYADFIDVSVNYEEISFSVLDNGRGIPQGENKDLSKPTPVVIYTKLNSGGKYDDESYTFSGGLHGVGSVVVNALSKDLYVKTWRSNEVTKMKFSYGDLLDYDHNFEYDQTGSGTYVECHPDMKHKLFSDILSDYEEDIKSRLSLLKTLMPRVSYRYNDKEIGSQSFDKFLVLSKYPVLDNSITLESKDVLVSLNWSRETNKMTLKSFCNTIYNPNGGDHERGVHDALIEYFNTPDVLLGLNLAVSVLYPGVEYDGQAKLKANSKEMRAYVKDYVLQSLKKYFKSNPEDKDLISQLIKSKRDEINRRNNKGSVKRDRKSAFLNSLGVSGFSDCSTKNRSEAELFIVEGESAAGSAKQARNISTQAILPIRGKIINAYTSDVKSLLKNAEVATIVSSIGAGIYQDFNLEDSRYGKIIIFSDADEDGKNIACLVLSLFMNIMPDLVNEGHLYLSLPPLYGIKKVNEFIPIYDEITKESYLKKGYEIQRYKGLGEMNPSQLKVACMDPETRSILQIKTTEECANIVEQIMGGNATYRRSLLIEEGILV